MSQLCNRCGMPVRPGFKFCNVCGAPLDESTKVEDSAVPYSDYEGMKGRAVRAMTGGNAGTFYPAYPSCTIGREDTDIVISEDATLSPQHARLATRKDKTVLEDLDSLNGVFLRAKDKVLLHDNDILRAGDHYFLFQYFSNDHFTEEYGTEFYAAPCRGEHFRIVEILRGGRRGRACMAPDGGIIVGRTEGDFTFPEDEKMSDKHFSIRWTQRGGILIDHSSNGTYIQIHEATSVEQGDLFFAGQTLFRVI